MTVLHHQQRSQLVTLSLAAARVQGEGEALALRDEGYTASENGVQLRRSEGTTINPSQLKREVC